MAEINIHSDRPAGASGGGGGFASNTSSDALGRGISDLSKVAGSLITAGIKSARTDRISRSILSLSELQAGWRADGMRTIERETKTRDWISQLDINASDKMAIRQGAAVRQLKSERLAGGRIAQVNIQTNEIAGIAGEAAGVKGEYTQAVDSFGEQNARMEASAVNGTAAWNTAIDVNLKDNSEVAQAQKVVFSANYMEASNGVFDFMARREAHKIFIGTRGDPVIGTDIKEELDSRAGEWKRRVSVLRQHVTSRFIAESANNIKNSLSISGVEQMWKGMQLDITQRLTPNFLRETGISYEDAITVLNAEDTAVTKWSKEIFKTGTDASAAEKHENATKIITAKILFEAAETRAGFKKNNPALHDLLIKNEAGVLTAMVQISKMMANTGQRGGLRKVIKDYTDPFSKQFAETAIKTLATTRGERGSEWFIDLMNQVQDNSIMAAFPELVSSYKSVMKSVIAGIRKKNEKAADTIQEKHDRWLRTNKHNTIILDGIGGS
jgi:hypothetical protein